MPWPPTAGGVCVGGGVAPPPVGIKGPKNERENLYYILANFTVFKEIVAFLVN
jgi:hypothetical protein